MFRKFYILAFALTGCHALQLRGSSIVDDNGSTVYIRGINYFG